MATPPTTIPRHLDPNVVADLGARHWATKAACRGADTAIFYAAEADLEATLAARAYCTTCPVQTPCRTYAIATGQRYGTWGNTTPSQRRRHARRQAA